MPEDWGGDTIVMPVSAKTKEGLNELLDMVLLVSDVEELRAETNVPAEGIIIESHMEKGRGRVGVALVEHGTLKPGDYIAAGSTYGKIRNLEKPTGESLKSAGPSTPVVITGLKELPDFGEEFVSYQSEKAAKDNAYNASLLKKSDTANTASSGSELLKIISRTKSLSDLNILLKADVQGSLTSVTDSLKTLNTDEVQVRIVGSGVGVITESDLHTASSSGAIIYGFNVSLPTHLKHLASRDKVSIRLFSVIYELIDDVKKEMEGLLAPEIIEEELGTLNVKGIFKITKTEVICGGEVTKGTLKMPSLARLKRDKKVIADELEIVALKRGPQEVKEVLEGEMCGLSFHSASRVEVQENDRIELYSRTTKTRTL